MRIDLSSWDLSGHTLFVLFASNRDEIVNSCLLFSVISHDAPLNGARFFPFFGANFRKLGRACISNWHRHIIAAYSPCASGMWLYWSKYCWQQKNGNVVSCHVAAATPYVWQWNALKPGVYLIVLRPFHCNAMLPQRQAAREFYSESSSGTTTTGSVYWDVNIFSYSGVVCNLRNVESHT